MSRYEIPARNPNRICVLGWDPPLATYFAQIFDTTPTLGPLPDDGPDHWIGATEGEIPTVADLIAQLARWATVNPDLADRLEADRVAEPAWNRPAELGELIAHLQRDEPTTVAVETDIPDIE